MSQDPDVRQQVIERLRWSANALQTLPPSAVVHQASDALRDAADLLTSQPAPSGWQPIETAPKMRKIIVTYLNALRKRRVVMGCYYLAHSLEMDGDYADVGDYDEATGESYAPEGWYEEHDSDNPLMPLQEQPTHWMPLPQPPDASPAKEAPTLAHQLGALLQEAGLTPKFGLRQQGKYETVERMRAEGASWDEIGKAIGWTGSAVERFYALEADASPKEPRDGE